MMCSDQECSGEGLTRRSFLTATTATFVGFPTSEQQTGVQQPKAQPETRVLDDPTVEHGRVVFIHNGKETIDGYLARPKKEGTYPGVLVIAGNRITEEYIPNTCVALALAGFVGLAPNVFHPLPEDAKTPEDFNRALANHTELD